VSQINLIDLTSNISQVVSQTVKDQLRKKKNIIVTGLPESNDESDVVALRSLCEQHLDCKLDEMRLNAEELVKHQVIILDGYLLPYRRTKLPQSFWLLLRKT